MNSNTATWKAGVFKLEVNFYHTDEWKALRKECLRRDRNKCQRCYKHHARGFNLTAHHIIPRLEGGADKIENLIALCVPCHDYAEIHRLMSCAAIIGSTDTQRTKAGEDHDYPDDWHKWIYGPARRPPVWWQRLCHERSQNEEKEPPATKPRGKGQKGRRKKRK